ncbi:hypothetical protein Pint_08366 [Pistacia integerrima]|uniref:Uncharacterized protein n=1 Tax=Pistacia integerrima TaxID=434235 RepID=A0ACC0XY85_9ROSI|nr:hypothetical protein Pint_08366 [Pistacia integerrima]
MGVLGDSQIDGGGGGGGGYGLWGGCFRGLVRRKQVDSMHTKVGRHHQLAKDLSVLHLIAIACSASHTTFCCFKRLVFSYPSKRFAFVKFRCGLVDPQFLVCWLNNWSRSVYFSWNGG